MNQLLQITNSKDRAKLKLYKNLCQAIYNKNNKNFIHPWSMFLVKGYRDQAIQ